MQEYQNMMSYDSSQISHVSFSFDNHRAQQKEPRKTIDQYLRLKTNQSIEDKINTGVHRSQCQRSLKTQQCDFDNSYHAQLKNDQQALRMESMTKQYQLKLNKQEEFFALREWKLKQQIENLNLQVCSLNEEVRRLRACGKQQSYHCSLCSNGQVITHLQSVLHQSQENHSHCLDIKKQLTRRVQDTTSKLQSLEQEHEKLYQQCRVLTKQIRSINSDMNKYEGQRDQMRNLLQKKQKQWSQKEMNYQQLVQQLQKKNSYLQEIKEDSIKISKATTSQLPLSSIENSMNSSMIKQQKGSSCQKQRNSVSKISHVQRQDLGNLENYPFYRRTADMNRSIRLTEQKRAKIESMKWKLF